MMRATETMATVPSAQAEARAALQAAGVPDPRREALHLWRAVTGRDPGVDMLMNDREVDPADLSRLRGLVARRSSGEPLAYVTGTIGFRHLDLLSDRRGLIPRPETEGLVEVALQCCRTGVAADIGTGSGAIALALRQE